MKGYIIIRKIPETCSGCRFVKEDTRAFGVPFCAVVYGRTLQDIDPDKERPEWCPIEPIQQDDEKMMEEHNG